MSQTSSIDATALTQLVGLLFQAKGVPEDGARLVAQSLVSADQEGVASHGVALVPMYLERLRAGSVNALAVPEIAEDHGGLLVMAAHGALGQVSSGMAVDLVLERARVHGVAAVAVRDAFHFGTAAFWARRMAAAGMIGFAFSNTRPLMPAPGGAERVVGNNPMSIAFPSAASGEPIVVDMAMSATAMGKIRLAEAAGNPIPAGWAVDAQGNSTTSPTDAINGMLLPAAGPKGFGLAVAIDLLCGALSGGAVGAAVRPLYGDLSQPYGCAHMFIAINAASVGAGAGIGAAVSAFAQSIRDSKKAPGTDRIYAPGDLERARRAGNGEHCTLPDDVIKSLNQLAEQTGVAARLEAQ
ncbi:Ldh family oxidoreductase [Ottowia sp. VDI28]|uniref:Ldh family oxidoreductase n=1 Tax=Ottowia sp. VDI28 TaxID=3133968 RepID=UPI003C2FE52A